MSMNALLEEKYNQLKAADDYECWYLVKQPTSFDALCYLVSILKKYQDNDSKGNLQEYIKNQVNLLKKTKPNIEISDNYRALRVAACFGLIKMQSSGYNDAVVSSIYYEIEKRCSGVFEQKEKYADIIKRQIEKMFLSSDIDESKDSVRRKFRLFPVMLLYKVLIELGRTTGKYTIDMTEYRYIIATTNVFENYLDALLLVKLMRQEPDCKPKFEEFRTKFDNRMIQALKQLDTLVVEKDSISLNKEYIPEVTQKVFAFENNPNSFYDAGYVSFLCSTRPLIDIDKKNGTSINTEDEKYSVKWFSSMAQQFSSADIESEQLYKDFRAKYGPEVLKTVEGIDLLHKIFINETRDKENLCYVLEFDKQFSQFGGIGGGSAYKYGLYYSADKQSWMAGSSRNPKVLSIEDAITLGTKIRNEILEGVKVIESAGELSELKDYAELNTKLYEVMPITINKKWVIKYFHMLFPQLFPPFYNDEWQNKVLTAIDEEPDGNSFVRMGQIALFVKKCGISTLAFSKVIYNLDSLGDIEDEQEPTDVNELCTFESEIKNGKNIVVYGTPGCGKSFHVQNTLLKEFGVANDEQHRIRTTFYQDYTNTDFVGQIIPKVKEDKSVTYEFNPGPFALAMKMAIEHSNEPVALVIEELNRGNAASIFGDIFQLLDRDDDGKSQYKITNVNLQDYLNNMFKERNLHFDYIVIPSNLYIVATMNTSDQNVFTLDTAFKRRWKFEKLPNIFASDHKYAEYFVPGMDGITWKTLVKAINNFIVSRADELSSEDKQLGVYFIGKETLSETKEGTTNETKKKEFAYKLLEYLWDDVAKYNHSDWFGPDVKTLDQLIEEYMTKGQEVFVDGILK